MINTDECWIFAGYKNKGGYGEISHYSKTLNRQITERAHRTVYQHFYGKLTSEQHLDHLCNIRACVNPDHLEPVTLRENIDRAIILKNGGRNICVNGHDKEIVGWTYRRTKKHPYKACKACEKTYQMRGKGQLIRSSYQA